MSSIILHLILSTVIYIPTIDAIGCWCLWNNFRCCMNPKPQTQDVATQTDTRNPLLTPATETMSNDHDFDGNLIRDSTSSSRYSSEYVDNESDDDDKSESRLSGLNVVIPFQDDFDRNLSVTVEIDSPFLCNDNSTCTFKYFTEASSLNLYGQPSIFDRTPLGQTLQIHQFFGQFYTYHLDAQAAPRILTNFIKELKTVIHGMSEIIELAEKGNYLSYANSNHQSVVTINEALTSLVVSCAPVILSTSVKFMEILIPKKIQKQKHGISSEDFIAKFSFGLKNWLEIMTQQIHDFKIGNANIDSAESVISLTMYNESHIELNQLMESFFIMNVFDYDHAINSQSGVHFHWESNLFCDQTLYNDPLHVIPLHLMMTMHRVFMLHAIQRNTQRPLNIKYGLEHGYDVDTRELFYIVSVSSDKAKAAVYEMKEMKRRIRLLVDGCQDMIDRF
eukprot:838000_1